MTSPARGRTFTCEVCHQPTTRMLGFLGTVTPTDGPGGLSLRSAIHGYCKAHRALVEAGFPAGLRAEGEAQIVSDPPAELRPDDVCGFEAAVDEMRISSVNSAGLGPAGAYQGNLAAAPDACPHCGAALSWGTGPHLFEAARREHATAWECTGCGAAGMLIGARLI